MGFTGRIPSISVDDLSTRSDEFGSFTIKIPSDKMQPEFSLLATAPGYAPKNSTVIPGKVDIVLRRVP